MIASYWPTGIGRMTLGWKESPWKADGMSPLDWFNANFSSFIVTPGDIQAMAIPLDDVPCQFDFGGVYFLVDDGRGEIVYVGITFDVANRVLTHRRDKGFTRVYAFPFTQVMAHEIEEFYIAALNPLLNTRARGVGAEAARKALAEVKSGELWPGWIIPEWQVVIP